jgi:hypothetical protein
LRHQVDFLPSPYLAVPAVSLGETELPEFTRRPVLCSPPLRNPSTYRYTQAFANRDDANTCACLSATEKKARTLTPLIVNKKQGL